MGVYDDPKVQKYVSTIGKTTGFEGERPQLPWEFTVMDDPVVNAFALPGGYIFITRGILTHMNSEAEMATVIGHEIGHVTARHSVQQMTREQMGQVALVAGAIASTQVAPAPRRAEIGTWRAVPQVRAGCRKSGRRAGIQVRPE